ncbi:MAG: hypothetical protein RLZZ597_728 [Cyanobacteriota bacterium]|jgi:hypothetical protein
MDQGFKSLIVAGHLIRGVCYATPSLQEGSPRIATIPPERVGLQGEYDHYGLAKRIQARFRERLGRIETAKVTIKQRGGVIILRGQVDRRDILEDLITIALSTEGTTHVEVWDMAIGALDPAPKLQVA